MSTRVYGLGAVPYGGGVPAAARSDAPKRTSLIFQPGRPSRAVPTPKVLLPRRPAEQPAVTGTKTEVTRASGGNSFRPFDPNVGGRPGTLPQNTRSAAGTGVTRTTTVPLPKKRAVEDVSPQTGPTAADGVQQAPSSAGSGSGGSSIDTTDGAQAQSGEAPAAAAASASEEQGGSSPGMWIGGIVVGGWLLWTVYRRRQ